MSFANDLINELSSNNARLTELLQTGYSDFDHVLAVEGDDDATFYRDYVDDYLQGNTLIFSCGNKDGVISLKDASDEYDWGRKPSIRYVCDKDFDDILDCKRGDIIYSDLYSIESYLTLGEFALYIARKEGRVHVSEKKKAEFLKLFEEEMTRCSIHLKVITAAMIEIRRFGVHPEFDGAKIIDFFSIEDGVLSPKDIDLKKAFELWNCDINLSDEEIKARVENLEDSAFRNWVRGKYLLQISKKVFDNVCSRVLEKRLPECTNFFGRSGMKYIKLAMPELEFLRHGLNN